MLAMRDMTAEGLAVLEAVDGFAPLRNGLRQLAAERGDWAGYPIPLQDLPLTVEPNFPNAEKMMEIGRPQQEIDDDLQGARLVNRFYSRRRRCDIYIWETKDGKRDWGLVPAAHGLAHALSTLGAADAWGIEQEHNALKTLGTLIRHRPFKQYVLTGMFMETSKRSGLTYLFRRLRPTVVLDVRARTDAERERTRVLCALCLHPIGYYEGSWAGAMCPTDDVIAHLMLMRGDEVMFWRRSNQHPPHRPEAGL